MKNWWDTSWLNAGNQAYLENAYDTILQNPDTAFGKWQEIYSKDDISHGDIIKKFQNLKVEYNKPVSISKESSNILKQIAVQKLIFSYRLLGHQCSNVNPLSERPLIDIPELQASYYGFRPNDLNNSFSCEDLIGPDKRSLKEIIENLQKIYCGSVGAEYLHIPDSTERRWVQENLEYTLLDLNFDKDKKISILEQLVAADGLEKYLHAKYPGAKRFSMEGSDSLLVALDQIVSTAPRKGIQEIILAMTHRGRLNLLVNLLGKFPAELFEQFENKHNTKLESGDVKYHQGFSSDLELSSGNLHLSMAFNPSHLEIVCPVACGSVRARQDRRNDINGDQVLCISMHGDAAFAGQGVVMETLNMSRTDAYKIGGTIHIIVNNQIGFTTSDPKQSRSTMYCSDIGKMLAVPIFHVNADDPEAVAAIAKLALSYRNRFHKDIIIDLVGYRRMGHNEADEPAATQPLMYKKIRAHPPVKQIYADKLVAEGVCTVADIENLAKTYRDTLDKRDQAVVKRLSNNWKSLHAPDWSPFNLKDWRIATNTGVAIEQLRKIANKRDTAPEGFELDPRVDKIISARRKMTDTGENLDWGYCETLAYATLVNEGYGVRFSGEDSERGTFFHRHAVWHDYNNGQTYTSLQHISPQQGKFMIYNSTLSEEAVLGFEYGYSTSEPRTLTIWEAQFGDFANGAQVLIDQFISSGELKWGRLSGLVMLLPHGYEGQGPEHSSARIERYLQLCVRHNMQVCIPSTPSQMFHLLRRQILRPLRKPLIIITPKSLLRHKLVVSKLADLSTGEFLTIIGDGIVNIESCEKIIICSGKIYYELLQAREKHNKNNIAIIRIEQIHPFPEVELEELFKMYANAKEIVWCQEEPKNQGCWYSMQHHIRNAMSPEQNLNYVGRLDSASPAVGYYNLHEQQQKELISAAILGKQ